MLSTIENSSAALTTFFKNLDEIFSQSCLSSLPPIKTILLFLSVKYFITSSKYSKGYLLVFQTLPGDTAINPSFKLFWLIKLFTF